MRKEMSSKYDSKQVENGKYDFWLANKSFELHDLTKTPFCIVIPPPNVTGKLHIGHAWDGTLQDMIIRYKRLKGFDTLWVPGTDHAGIATQAKVDAKLREQGISRYDLGREKFLEVAWDWKHEYHSFIREQWKMLGLSLDYSKERFTLDEGLSEAVRTVFVKLYEKGLIYQGYRIINWDPVQRTALSNIEVIYEEKQSNMYYFKYYFEDDKTKYLEVATTRPETMFGDVCVVVNPNDEKYKDVIGKKVINPANGDVLPIIGDEYVEIGFGTGAMKCTPAHDPNDFILGEKYGFPKIIVMNPDGTMNEKAGKYAGLDRFECRNQLVEDIKNNGLLIKIDDKYVNNVGFSERSHAIVEPYLSKQWFVKMKPLADQSLDFQKSLEKVKFIPERFEKIFTNWMTGIEDWCISRQLWWGHRIPAWYHNETGEVYVGMKAPEDIENWHQDEDVLDTWFSSALWPFSTLGWPNTESEDFKRYFPTDTLVTGYDIIFFWVSRMIFQSLEFTKQKPFKACLIHGLIRDSQGRKMSKSLGNGVDPIAVINQYGCDALRFFLTTNSAPGQDLRYSDEKINAAWNFINKIWNASRFCIMNFPENYEFKGVEYAHTSIYDKDILNKLNNLIIKLNDSMDNYEFVIAGSILYNFIYDDFCSTYVEMAKLVLNGDDEEAKKSTLSVLFYCLDAIVTLLHPYIPFVTEEIYQTLHNDDTKCIVLDSKWPEYNKEFECNETITNSINDIIKNVRIIKNDHNLAPNKKISLHLVISDKTVSNDIKNNLKYIERYCFAENIVVEEELSTQEKGFTIPLTNITLFIPLSDIVNKDEEIARLTKELEKLNAEIERSNKMLNNPSFLAKAPEAKVNVEKQKLVDYQERLEIVKKSLEEYK